MDESYLSTDASSHTFAHDAAPAVVTDSQLLAEYARTQSPETFARIVERHSAAVYSVCFAILRDPHAAEDAMQSVFLVLLRKAPALKPSVVLAGWLNICARSCAREQQRREHRRARRERESAELRPGTDAPPDAERDELRSRVGSVLASLPSLQRDAIVLRFCYGHSEASAAQELGCEANALHARVTRGLARIRDRLRRGGIEIPAALILLLLRPELGPGFTIPRFHGTVRGPGISPKALSVAKTVAGAGAFAAFKSLVAAAILCALVLYSLPAATDFRNRRSATRELPFKVAAQAAGNFQSPGPRALKPIAIADRRSPISESDLTSWKAFGALRVDAAPHEMAVPLTHKDPATWAVGGLMNRTLWDLSTTTVTIGARVGLDQRSPAARAFYGLVVDDETDFNTVLENAANCEASYQPNADPAHATHGELTEYVISKDCVELRVDGKTVSRSPWPRPVGKIYIGIQAGCRGASGSSACHLTDVSFRAIENDAPALTF